MIRWILAGAAIQIGAPAAATAVVEIVPTDPALIVDRVMDQQPLNVVVPVRLTAKGGNVDDLYLIASNLTSDGDPKIVIDRGNIALERVGLTSDQPRDVRVTFTLTQAGNYRGELEFRSASANPVKLPVEFHLRPAVLRRDPAAGDLAIQAVIDKSPATASVLLRLAAIDAELKNVTSLRSDLKHATDKGITIDASNVAVAPFNLVQGQPTDVRITVSNIARPGAYDGTIAFLVPGQVAPALTVPVRLTAEPRPRVTPIAATESWSAVNCGNGLSCTLAELFVGSLAVNDERRLQLDNESGAAATIDRTAFSLKGEKSGYRPKETELRIGVSDASKPGDTIALKPGVNPIVVQIDRRKLPPDRYQGDVRFYLHNADEPVRVMTDLNVRVGPLLPLIIIVLGIVVGRIARDQTTPEAQIQLRLWPRLLRVRALIDTIADDRIREWLRDRLGRIGTRIEAATEPESVLSKDVDALTAAVNALRGLEQLTERLIERHLDALATQLRPKIDEARNAVLKDDLATAERVLSEIERAIAQAQEDQAMGADEAHDFNLSLSSFSALLKTAAAGSAPTRERRGMWLLAFLAGTPWRSPEMRYWLIRPFLYLILLAALAFIGFQTLYINIATFGVSFADYIGLFIWGLSADVVQRTLQNLQAPKS